MKILVVIPTHDRLEFLDEAIASVKAQTRQADSLVVVGNVMSSTHSDVTYIASDATLDIRLNSVINDSDCDAFIMLSDDDHLRPRYIEKTVQRMEDTGADIVYTEQGLIPVTALIRKSIWAKAGGYCDIGFFDWDFNWSCQEAGAMTEAIREHLFYYRQHPAQVANHAQMRASGEWARLKAIILEKHPNRGKFIS